MASASVDTRVPIEERRGLFIMPVSLRVRILTCLAHVVNSHRIPTVCGFGKRTIRFHTNWKPVDSSLLMWSRSIDKPTVA